MISVAISKEPADESGWYAVYSQPCQELRTLENLCNQSFVCFLPRINVELIRHGHRVAISEALFPLYLFILKLGEATGWPQEVLVVLPGLSSSGVTARVPAALMVALVEQPERHQAFFDVGDQLKVINGPFVAIEAVLLRVYETSDGEARVMELIDILTRPQQLTCRPARCAKRRRKV